MLRRERTQWIVTKPDLPNLLLIMTDEQPVHTVRAYGHDWVSTPHLDALAEAGTRFTNAYTSSPVCTPARAGLFTGVYSHNNGAWGNHMALSQDARTIGHYFRSQGYQVGYIGKWHLDGLDYFGTGVCPAEFEDRYWYDGRRHLDYLGPEKSRLWRSQSLDTVDKLRQAGVDREFTWGGQVTNRALDFLAEARRHGPWVLVVSYDEPHHPWTCPPEFLARFADRDLPRPDSFGTRFEHKPVVQQEWNRWLNMDEARLLYHQRQTLAATEFVDSEIGRVLDAAGGLDNTFIVFTSDHGNQLGAHHLIWKGPWMYEESVKVPLLARGPGLKQGCVEDRVVSHIDLLPTLLDLCGLPIPPIMDGRSFAGLIRPGQAPPPDPGQAIIEFNRFQLDRDDFGAFFPIRAIVRDGFKLVVNLFDLDELYDLSRDPHEMHNLIDQPACAAIRDPLHRDLLTWMYVRRDAFRAPAWERRPWSRDRRFALCDGRIRTTPLDGLGPTARGYMTGLPIEYDFRL